MPLEILIVDDDPDDVELTRQVLYKGRTPVRIDTAWNGEQALAKLRAASPRELPHLILLDLNMPIMDGREFLKAAKTDPELKKVPVVVFTTARAAEEIVKCYGLGANGFVNKPMGIDRYGELELIIEEYWIQRERRARS